MDPQTTARLLEINRRFYAEFGPAFAATRRRIQDGVRRVLTALPDPSDGCWLDLGCGSGALAVEWLKAGRRSAYLGLDFSASLLAEACQSVADLPNSRQVTFAQVDLADPHWPAALPACFGASSFAVLHHLPSQALREQVLQRLRSLLPPGATFIHSEWQFQNSPKLMARRVPWERVGLAESDLEPGDTLLDWRFALSGQPEQTGLRYVHLFNRAELSALAQASGFRVLDEFESDGQGGHLSLYQIWEAAD